jgi:type II secretory pathway pseudopilin PulG
MPKMIRAKPRNNTGFDTSGYVAKSNKEYFVRTTHMNRLLRNRSGMTLLEVMFAFGIFTAAVLVFAATIPMSAKSANMNGSNAQALSLAQHKIDQMRAVGYGRLTYNDLNDPENIIDNSPSVQPYEFDQVDGLANYFGAQATGKITITDVVPNEVRQVTVTIAWPGMGAKQSAGNFTLTALIAQQ